MATGTSKGHASQLSTFRKWDVEGQGITATKMEIIDWKEWVVGVMNSNNVHEAQKQVLRE
jgi:hypothetical protein